MDAQEKIHRISAVLFAGCIQRFHEPELDLRYYDATAKELVYSVDYRAIMRRLELTGWIAKAINHLMFA